MTQAIASTSSTQPAVAALKMILTPVMTLGSHDRQMRYISYFPGGKQMVSGGWDYTTRRWDLQAGKEIEDVRDFCDWAVYAVAVSRDGRWVVTAGGDEERGELKTCEVETGMVKKFQGHSRVINCIDISEDSMLLASGSDDSTTRIWSLDTGKLVAGPFKSADWVGAIRFSQDRKKLAIKSVTGSCLEVWDVHTQKLDRRVGKSLGGYGTYAPVFWTNRETILAAFAFASEVGGAVSATTIYEFDASTLETLGAPFQSHTTVILGLALSFDGVLLASTSNDHAIKLWAFESRQLLASFHILNVDIITLSPNSHQLAYTLAALTQNENKIFICNIPPGILSTIGLAQEANTTTPENPTLHDPGPLNSDATRRRANVRRNPAPPVISFLPRPLPTRELQQPGFLRHLRKLFPTSSRSSAVPPTHCQDGQPRDPLHETVLHSQPQLECAGLPNRFFDGSETTYPQRRAVNAGSQQAQHEETHLHRFVEQHLSFRRSTPSNDPQVVEVAAGRKFTRLAAADLPEYKKVNDTRRILRVQQQPGVPQDTAGNDPSYESSDNDSLPDVHWCKAFLCYYSCWSHGKPRMPPRWILERVDEYGQDGTTSGSRGGAPGNN
ncbi:WD40 repeat-like protein [Rhizopogon salebrosus TDB-379]|nr:WD40 repeat-like protein [Rhizopogon salebrosus TDB-379]